MVKYIAIVTCCVGCLLVITACPPRASHSASQVAAPPEQSAAAPQQPAVPHPTPVKHELPAAGSLGQGPLEDWPQDIPALPDYDGWYSYLGIMTNPKLIGAGPELLLVYMQDELVALDRASGAQRWATPVDYYGALAEPVISDQYVSLGEPDYVVLKLANGQPAPEVAAAELKPSADWHLAQRLDYDESLPNPRSAFDAAQRLLGNGFQPVSHVTLDHVRYLLAETYPAGHDYWGANGHLFALNLDDNGAPRVGTLTQLNVQPAAGQLADRFYATADPLDDPALLTAVVTAGINAYQDLIGRMAQATPAQLDALAVLAAYDLQSKRDTESYAMPAVQALNQQLLREPQPAYVERLIAWLQDERLQVVHPALLGPLAMCGGADAAAFLTDYYARQIPVEREAPTAPYRLNLQPEYTGDYHQPDPHETGWYSEVGVGSARYAAFTSDGLNSDRDIYLGVDQDGDGAFEEILPTGLVDCWFARSHPGGMRGPSASSGGQLTLQVVGQQVTIQHHEPVLQEQQQEYGGERHTYWEFTGDRLLNTTLTLDELRLDTDHDGLTDRAEELLITDPQSADTDGDGVPDSRDSCPNVNPAQAGPAERGAARALAYCFGLSRGDSGWWQNWQPTQPWAARYLRLENVGPVAFSGARSCWGIALDQAQSEAYERLLHGYNDYSAITIAVYTRDELLSQMYGGIDTAQLDAVSTTGDDPLQLGIPGVAHYIHISFALEGLLIAMVEVEGELFPVTMKQTWIS